SQETQRDEELNQVQDARQNRERHTRPVNRFLCLGSWGGVRSRRGCSRKWLPLSAIRRSDTPLALLISIGLRGQERENRFEENHNNGSNGKPAKVIARWRSNAQCEADER